MTLVLRHCPLWPFLPLTHWNVEMFNIGKQIKPSHLSCTIPHLLSGVPIGPESTLVSPSSHNAFYLISPHFRNENKDLPSRSYDRNPLV
jgi:hypothetical protein